MPTPRILLVDDEPAVRFGIRDFLEQQGYQVTEADGCGSAEESFQSVRPDVVLLDYVLPDGDALVLMRRLKAADPTVPILLLTGHGSIELAVRAIKEGAEQFLTKPVELASLHVMLQRLLQSGRDHRARLARRASEARLDPDPFLGESPVIRALATEARLLLHSESPVLILGPSGSGKGVLARWLHSHGLRADEAFVDLNCAGLNREFLESELFGHEKGAFTGAVASKPGLLDMAHRGTVFLDEIGDLHLEVQPKLLKVLEEQRFRRLGDVRERTVDVRLIAATHRDLPTLVREERFRGDLYFRINTLPLRLPALAERVADIPLLARHLLERLAGELGRPDLQLGSSAETALTGYAWPGNIRELRNVLERAILRTQGETVESQHLRFEDLTLQPQDPVATNLTLQEVERRHLERVLAETGGHVGHAAQRLDIPRSTLYQKLARLGLRAASAPAATDKARQ